MAESAEQGGSSWQGVSRGPVNEAAGAAEGGAMAARSAVTPSSPRPGAGPDEADSLLERPYRVDVSPPEGAPEHEQLRYAKFRRVLGQRIVDIDELRQLSWRGVPKELRTVAWQLLLGYLPANRARREASLKRKRGEYEADISRYYDVPDDSRSMQEQKMLRQIIVDVPRTHPDVPLFSLAPVHRSLERILYVWGVRHPATRYVQGMNDLASPIYVAFLSGYVDEPLSCDVSALPAEALARVEADTYWCFTALLDTIQDHYTFGQPGLQRMMFKLKELLRRIDAPLAEHMEEEGLMVEHFAVQWMNCLLIREVPLPVVIRCWDTYLAEENGFDAFHVYLCAAFLQRWSAELRKKPFNEMFMFLQALPTQDWGEAEVEDLLSQAFVLHSLFASAPKHLQQ